MLVTPRRSFKTLLCSQDGGVLLKAAAITGTLQASGIRSIAWMYFLGSFAKGTPEEVYDAIVKNRVHYSQLVQLHITDPRSCQELDPTINNPLSQAEDSPWAKFFENAELEKIIKQDIERCYPDNDFFQDHSIRSIMSRILFIYAKVNPTLSYRQGMHELLAPIVYLVHQERNKEDKDKDPDDVHTTMDASVEKILLALLDRNAIEADSHFVFSHLMDITGDWFSPGKRVTGPTNPLDEEAATTVVLKCRRIQHILLKNKDPELQDHLAALKIEPQIYLLRWVRLLLGREFHSLDDLMIIWDAVFAHSPDLVLVDYICVAMLVFIREQLLERDYTGCLTRLMKYPPVEDVRIFIEQAHTLISNRLQKPPPSQPPPIQASSPNTSQERSVQASASNIFATPPISSTTAPTSSHSKQKLRSTSKHDNSKVLQPLNPVGSVKHNLEIDTTTTDITLLQEQLRTLRDTQLTVAERIDSIAQSIQQTLTSNALQGATDPLFLALAELKQTKDILCGFIPAPARRPEPDQTADDEDNLVQEHPLVDCTQRKFLK